MFYEFGTILSSVALSKLDFLSHNLHVKYVRVLAKRGDTPRCLYLSLIYRRCFDDQNKIINCISTKFGTYKYNEEKTRCIDFQVIKSQVKAKTCKY